MIPPLPRPFTRLAWSNLAAQSAEQLSLAATPIVAVLVLGAGPGEVGLLATAQTLPFLLLSIPAGLVADRASRRRVMVVAELLRAVSLLGLLAAVWFSWLSIAVLAVLGFVGAVGTVGFSVAAPALVPSLVPRADLGRANGRLELARSMAFAGGPALAGALVSWAGASAAFVLAVVLSASAVVLLLGLQEPRRVPSPARRPWLELKDGVRVVWHHDMLRPMFLTGVVWNLSWFVLQAAYVPYAFRQLGLGTTAVGMTLAAFGAGLLTGALLSRRVIGAMPFGRAVQLGPVVSVLAAAVMVGTLAVPSGLLAGLSFFLLGAGPAIWTITSITLRQTVTPNALLGRVSAIFLTGSAGARPLGAALGGAVGATWGAPACLLLALTGFVLQAWLIMASRVRTMQQLPEAVA